MKREKKDEEIRFQKLISLKFISSIQTLSKTPYKINLKIFNNFIWKKNENTSSQVYDAETEEKRKGAFKWFASVNQLNHLLAINVGWKENEVPITWFKKGIMVGMQSHLYSFDGTQSKTITLIELKRFWESLYRLVAIYIYAGKFREANKGPQYMNGRESKTSHINSIPQRGKERQFLGWGNI